MVEPLFIFFPPPHQYYFVFVDFIAFRLSKHWVMVQYYRLKWSMYGFCFDNRTINNIQTFVSVMNIFAIFFFFSFFSSLYFTSVLVLWTDCQTGYVCTVIIYIYAIVCLWIKYQLATSRFIKQWIQKYQTYQEERNNDTSYITPDWPTNTQHFFYCYHVMPLPMCLPYIPFFIFHKPNVIFATHIRSDPDEWPNQFHSFIFDSQFVVFFLFSSLFRFCTFSLNCFTMADHLLRRLKSIIIIKIISVRLMTIIRRRSFTVDVIYSSLFIE